MNKDILTLSKLIVVGIFLSMIFSCTRTIKRSELVLSSGYYNNNETSKKYTGRTVSFFRIGELREEGFFENGILKSNTSYGYQGEVIVECNYKKKYFDDLNFSNVTRIVFVNCNEGEGVSYFTIRIITSNYEDVDFDKLKPLIINRINNSEIIDLVKGQQVTFKMVEGELENPTFEEVVFIK